MRFCCFILVFLLTSLCLPSAAKAVVFGQRLQKAQIMATAAPSLTTSATSAKRYRLLATGAELSAFAARMQALGFKTRQRGSVLRLDVPAQRLAELHGPERVLIDQGRKFFPYLDVALPAIGLSSALKTERRGRGVLIAILDTGTDFAHPDFLNSDGSTRFVAYWDQTADNNQDSEWYGVFCDAVDINATLLYGDRHGCPNRADEPYEDFLPNGHGSHVAGIAASSDRTYTGVAPEALLVGVRMTFEETGLIDALLWVEAIAKLYNLPVVINLSLGSNDGGHDGDAPSEQIIDQISAPGLVVVAAAGNEGSQAIHVAAPASPSEHRARFVLSGLSNPDMFHAEVWSHDAEGFKVGVALENKTTGIGEVLAETLWAYSELAAQGLASADLKVAGKVAVKVSALAQTSTTGVGVRFEIAKADQSLSAYVYHLFWQAPSGSADAWLTDRLGPFDDTTGPVVLQYANGATKTVMFVAGDNRKTLTLPGTARRAITVTGFVTRKTWPTVTGQIAQSTSEASLGSLLDIASLGPTRDGRIKPEITAPGEYIVSTMATTVNFGNELQQTDDLHWVQRGTSMASPHVAGVVALLLEGNEHVDPEHVKDFLLALAKNDDDTGVTPNADWGYGKLSLRNVTSQDLWANKLRSDIVAPSIGVVERKRGEQSLLLRWTTNEISSARIEYEGGQTTVQSFGLRHEVRLKPPLPDSVRIIAIDVFGNESTAVNVAVPERDCGCHASTSRGSLVWISLLTAAWLLLRRRAILQRKIL